MPPPSPTPDPAIAGFVARWTAAGAAERANYVLFLTELCDLLDLPPPDPAGDATESNAYVFERAVPLHQRDGKSTVGRIDLYRRGAFVLEAKQYAAGKPAAESAELALALELAPAKKTKIARGSEAWDDAMIKARGQAENYARNLPAGEPTPPFLLVVDVGHVFELYADFSQQGKAYLPFPDARANRIRLSDLHDAAVRAKLRAIWLEPLTLDPAKISAAVTRDVARTLAELAKHFEEKHDPAAVAAFLSRCLFCMFAEDVELLPRGSFTQLLESLRADPRAAVPALEDLFGSMNEGRFYSRLMRKLLRFNGGLFAESRALPLDGTALGLLIAASKQNWRQVEPAIFGTLLERALHPAERHKLGAHYTPRAYVERLVLPTVVEPLREEWAATRAAAVTLAGRGDLKGAIKETRAFHHRLCAVRVLDPACGSGNFLYVALEHLKRLEGEVLQLIEAFGENMRLDLGGETVDPHQFLGLELNPRAATIAELVLWIGYLQWHHRNRGATEWPEPVLRAFKNIECRDAVLAYDKKEFAKDAHGRTRFVWNRRTTKIDPVTGREVPDDKAVVPLDVFVNPRPAEWPQADFIVGNPPFLGNKRMRDDLGDGYTETLRAAYPEMPESADFVMYWWHKGAGEVLAGRSRRFGFITTNSIKQTFNRRVVQGAMDRGLYLTFAIPDHPWVEGSDGAAVRIAMTVGASSLPKPEAKLHRVSSETVATDGENSVQLASDLGLIAPDLTTGPDVSAAQKLQGNTGVCFQGVILIGEAFRISEGEFAGLRLSPKNLPPVVRPHLGGKDVVQSHRNNFVIDLFGINEESEVRKLYPHLYEHLSLHVRPERLQNRDPKRRAQWWLFGRSNEAMRAALRKLRRYIVTVETSKHKPFIFVKEGVCPDHKLYAIASDDAFILGSLSSRIHGVWALAAGGTLEDRPTWTNTTCFLPFPFPDCTEKQKEKIRALAEELDAHRKRAQARHGIGLTDLYNVLEKVRRVGRGVPAEPRLTEDGSPYQLTAKEKLLHDQALVSTLRQLHDDLDAAVAAAYGWPWPLTEAEILERVVALNAVRAAEEAQGIVRWLRPDYQKPLFAGENQSALALTEAVGGALRPDKSSAKKSGRKAPPATKTKIAWPKGLAERVRAVEAALAAEEKPATAADLAARFSRAKTPDILEILQTLVTLGRARPGDAKGTFVR